MSRGAADDTILCGADLAGYEGYGGRVAAGVLQLAGLGTGVCLIVDPGPLTSTGITTGQPASIRYLGEGYGIAGATIAYGARLMTDATGRWITATTGYTSIALALEAATVGETFNLLVDAVPAGYVEP